MVAYSSIHASVHLPIYASIHASIHRSDFVLIYVRILLSIALSNYVYIYPKLVPHRSNALQDLPQSGGNHGAFFDVCVGVVVVGEGLEK